MPGTPTPILGLAVPTVGGDSGSWGTELNADLAILDNLGAVVLYSESANFTVPAGTAVETLVRVTTGASTITITLPAPSSCQGKVFLVKKIDSGIGSVSVVPAVGTIDGNASWSVPNQFGFVRAISNGVNYDVIGTL